MCICFKFFGFIAFTVEPKKPNNEPDQVNNDQVSADPVTPIQDPVVVKQQRQTPRRSCRSGSLQRNHKRQSPGPLTRNHSSLEQGKTSSGRKLHRSASLERRKGSTGASNKTSGKQILTEVALPYATRLKLTKPTTPSFMK